MRRPTRIAKRVEQASPDIAKLVLDIANLCTEHDPDIDLDNIMIDIRTMRHDAVTSGSHHAGHVVVYVDLHPYVDSPLDIANTLAHELRHNGQDVRRMREVSEEDRTPGISRYWGDSTPHDNRPSEIDAREFAKMVVKDYARNRP